MRYSTRNFQLIIDTFTVQGLGRLGELLSPRVIVRRANDYSRNQFCEQLWGQQLLRSNCS